MKTIIKYAPILVAILISGCVSKVELVEDRDLLIGKSIYIYGTDDNIGIKNTVRNKLTKLGFIVKNNKKEAVLIADYNCSYYHDIIHYTITNFEFFISEKTTNNILLKYKFVGDTPLSANGVLDKAFKKIEENLFTEQKKT